MPKNRNADDKISSFNDHFLCAKCFAKFHEKELLADHIEKCSSTSIVCNLCGLQFRHNSNLARHIQCHGHVKQPKILKRNERPQSRKCDACDETVWRSKYKAHIRKKHCNRNGDETYECLKKSVGDVWVERVLNTDFSVEMSKVAKNLIIMKKLSSTQDLFVKPDNVRVKCSFCDKLLLPMSMRKHILNKHSGENKKIKCENCKFESNRLYDFKKHLLRCSKSGFRRRLKKRGPAKTNLG